MHGYLEFEKHIADLENKIHTLQSADNKDDPDKTAESIESLKEETLCALSALYQTLTPWQKVQVARHPNRPKFLDYASALIQDFIPLSGDRLFGEDCAIIAGIGRFQGSSVIFLGHEKGYDVPTRVKHNFGMARPEGYRKVVRITDIANRFFIPVISIVDTPGAYPGVEAEERGQAEAIAQSTSAFLKLRPPNISVIIGEGGSGGAVGIAVANKVLMLEHSIYSVISPEGAAAILWHDKSRAQDAANSMKITADDLLKLGIIDQVIAEPVGGAHREPKATIKAVGDAIADAMSALVELPQAEIRKLRQDKFFSIGRDIEQLT